MRRSLNEIRAVLQRASLGAGLPTGIAEDIGRAGELLSALGMDGIGAVLLAIRSGMPPSATLGYEHGVAVFHDASAALCGPSAIDLLAAGLAPGGVRLRGVDSPMLVAGFAAVRSADHGLEFTLSFEAGTAIARQGIVGLNGAAPPGGVEISITCRPALDHARCDDIVTAGIEVDEAAWRLAAVLAAKTNVPASETSRARGAGASEIDND